MGFGSGGGACCGTLPELNSGLDEMLWHVVMCTKHSIFFVSGPGPKGRKDTSHFSFSSVLMCANLGFGSVVDVM